MFSYSKVSLGVSRFKSIGIFKPTYCLLSLRRQVFQPFSQKDEDDLLRIVTTKPRHVLRHVRQQAWRSRKRELYFRHSVTHLMIILQEYLRKEVIKSDDASLIMEGIIEECVKFSQHDMAHLLFRAFLRFRKYNCKININALRFLFDSYKATNSIESMVQLAEEIKGDPSLRALCVAAYLFGKDIDKAELLLKTIPFHELTSEDIIALAYGYDQCSKHDELMQLLKKVPSYRKASDETSNNSTNSGTSTEAERTGNEYVTDPEIILIDLANIYLVFFQIFWLRDNHEAFMTVLQAVLDEKIPIDEKMFAIILRQRLRHISSIEEMETVLSELAELGFLPDITANSIIIATYARLQHYGDSGGERLILSKVEMLLEAIENRLKQPDPDNDISPQHLCAVIRGYGAAKQREKLLEAWERMQFPGISDDPRVFSELLRWLSTTGNVKGVLYIKDQMEEKRAMIDSKCYTWILRALGKYYPRHVERMYSEIQTRGIRMDLHLATTLIGVFGDLGEMNHVEDIIAFMRQREAAKAIELTPFYYAVLLRIFSSNLPRAIGIYKEACSRQLENHSYIQCTMLNVYGNQKPIGSHDKELNEFLGRCSKPWTTDIYSVLLNIYAKRGDKGKEKFEELLKEMKDNKVEFSDVTYGTIVTAYARWGEHIKIHESLEHMKEHGGKATATFYAVLASSFQRTGDFDGVSEAWDDLISSKLFPDSDVFNHFLLLYNRQHDTKNMQRVLDNMIHVVPPNPVTATTILDMLGKTGRISEMEALLDDMKNNPDTIPTSVTYHQTMNAYAKVGDVAKMEGVYKELMGKPGITESAVTFNILADGYGRAKRFEQLEELLQRRKSQNIPMDELGFCILANVYGRGKLIESVRALVNEIKQKDSKIKISKKTIFALIDAFSHCKDIEGMNTWVDELQQFNRSSGTEWIDRDLMAIIIHYSRIGQMERAEMYLEELKKMGVEPFYSVTNALLRGYAIVNNFEKVVDILQLMRSQNTVPDSSTSLLLSSAFLKAGYHEQAKQIIEWRRQYARGASNQAN